MTDCCILLHPGVSTLAVIYAKGFELHQSRFTCLDMQQGLHTQTSTAGSS